MDNKKQYEMPSIEVITFETSEILDITTSNFGTGPFAGEEEVEF